MLAKSSFNSRSLGVCCARFSPVSSRVAIRQAHSTRLTTNSRRDIAKPIGAAYSAGFSGFVGGCRIVEAYKEDRKRIGAELEVFAPLDTVWHVLRDYESLAEFVPNLAICKRLPSDGDPNAVLLYQKAFSQTVFWRVEASAVLRVTEHELAGRGRELRFQMVSGDFEAFKGRWVLERVGSGADESTLLRYEIQVVPKLQHVPLPRALLAHILEHGLPANISAIAARAERVVRTQASAWSAPPAPTSVSASPEAGSADVAAARQRSGSFASTSGRPVDARDGGAPWRLRSDADADLERAASAPGWVRNRRPMYLGVSSVPLPGQRVVGEPIVQPGSYDDTGDDRSNAIRARLAAASAASKARAGGGGAAALPSYPAFDFIDWNEQGAQRRIGGSLLRQTEVHLRKLDVDGCLHRRVVAGVQIEAPLEEVWAVITDYENLANIMPALALSEVVPPARNRSYPPGMVRLRQLAVKKLAYVEVHTEMVLDVLEKFGNELQFRQYEGDFDVCQGKWILEESPFNHLRDSPATVVRYCVEMAMQTDSFDALGMVEPLVERICVEDIPANLAALKAYVEGGRPLEVGQEQRPKLDTLEGLKAELMRLYGDVQEIPARADLRAAGRVDIEFAIAALGGTRVVAEAMQWTTKTPSRRPKGYWTQETLQLEVDAFNAANGQPPRTVPSKPVLYEGGRKDLFNVITKLGGFQRVAELLNYTYMPKACNGEAGAPVNRLKFKDDADAVIGSDADELVSVQDLLSEAKKLAQEMEYSGGRGRPKKPLAKMKLNTHEMDRFLKEPGPARFSEANARGAAAAPSSPSKPATKRGRGSAPNGLDSSGTAASGRSLERFEARRQRAGYRKLSVEELKALLSDNDGFRDSIQPGK